MRALTALKNNGYFIHVLNIDIIFLQEFKTLVKCVFINAVI